jgi:hypothetical protein
MTKPEYILEFMRDGDFRYFIVTNGYDNDVIRQMQPTQIEDSVERMNKFFSNTTGAYRVKLYTSNELKRDGNPKQDPQIFEVQLTGQKIGGFYEEEVIVRNPSQNENLGSYESFGGGMGMGGNGIFGVETYMTQTREIMDLKEKIKSLEHKLELMDFTHKHEINRLSDRHKTELEKAKDSQAILGQGLGMFMSKMGMDSE